MIQTGPVSAFLGVLLTLAGIALPAIATVMALRRWVVVVSWRHAALFLGLTLCFLHGAVFTSQVPVPIDDAARGVPFRGVTGGMEAKNGLTNDTVHLFLPWMQVAREELGHGRVPLWNRYSFSGYPLLANAEAAPFSPIFLATLFVPLPKQIVAMAGLKLFFALLFSYLYLRHERASDPAACFGAIVFTFTTWMTVFLYYSMTAVGALLPAALFALQRAVDQPSKRSIAFVAAVVATLMLNGHPETVLHVAIAAAMLLAIDFGLASRKLEWLGRLKFSIVGSLAGLALAAPAWIPAAEQVRLSTRYAVLQSATGGYTFPLVAAFALVNPNGLGNPVRHNWNWYLNYAQVGFSYIGLLTLVLFLGAMASRRTPWRDRWLAVAAVVTYLVAMHWTPLAGLLDRVPPFSFTANDKLRFVSCFFAAVVAAKLLDRLREERRWPLALISAALIGIGWHVYRKQHALLHPSDLAGIAAVTVFIVAFIALRGRVDARKFAILAAAVTAVELFAFGASFNALVDGRLFRPRLPVIDESQRRGAGEPFRITGYDWAFVPNASGQYGMEDIRGSDPMSLASYSSFLDLIGVRDPATDLTRVVDVGHPIIDFLNVRFLIADPDATAETFRQSRGPNWQLVYRGADATLFENHHLMARFFTPRLVAASHREGLSEQLRTVSDFREVAIVDGWRGPDRIPQATIAASEISPVRWSLNVRAPGPSLVVSSQPYAPGWSAVVNGTETPLHRVNGAFIGFAVPAGDAHVELRYRPVAFYGSLLLAIVALGLLALARMRTGGSPRDEAAIRVERRGYSGAERE
ncbi:MAG TPA: YfhO family protein [Thermoanaerobaculia bacterium]|nr:YfhO family protein [Thermoanaerobaculia bacterium]